MRIGIVRVTPQFKEEELLMNAFNEHFKTLIFEYDESRDLFNVLCESDSFRNYSESEAIPFYEVFFTKNDDSTLSLKEVNKEKQYA